MTRIALTTLLVLGMSGTAWAQAGGAGGLGANGNTVGSKPAPKVAPQAPPAVPGARAEPTAVAPAARNAQEMPPTEALFDSINRGDLPAAKDAVNRGADINGKNVLGLTPIELAVDLGRNDISFLLLSLRGGAGYTTSRGPAGTRPPAAQARTERLAAERTDRAERAARARAAAVQPPVPTAPQTPRLFAGNGGAPVPQAGFLGFDSAR